MKFFSGSVVVLALAGLTPVAEAQFYPVPGSASAPPVLCTTCPAPYTNLPTAPYSLPIKRYVGRFVNGDAVNPVQGPIRSLFARHGAVAPENDRVYMMLGSTLASYQLSTFFTSTLNSSGTNLITNSADISGTRPPPEKYLNWFSHVDADNDHNWHTIQVDGQNRLAGFDWDDRGNVYLAYGPYGWGTVHDGTGGFSFVSQVYSGAGSDVPPGGVVSFKSGSTYYALITGGAQCALYDVTTATSPQFVRYISYSVASGSRIHVSGGDVVALLGVNAAGQSGLAIYQAATLAAGGTPAKAFTFSGGVGVTTDGVNFYTLAAVGSSSSIGVVSEATPGNPSSFTMSSTSVGNYSPKTITYGGNYLGVTVLESSFGNVHLFKLANKTPVEVPLNDYFRKYYEKPDSGFATPGAQRTINQAIPYSQGGHDYLIYEGTGLGDVYEVQAGDSITISENTGAGFGTPNLNSPTHGTGPFLGDPVTFSSSASTSDGLPVTIDWLSFGNIESGVLNDTASATSGVNVQHQYAGLTTSSQISSLKTVSAQEFGNSAISDSVTVSLSVPIPRLLVGTPATTITTGGTSSAGIVTGDVFKDASDGSIESHYDDYNLDSTDSTATPTATLPVGGCGAHTLIYTPHYVPYTGSGSSISPALPSNLHYTPTLLVGGNPSPLHYTVQPFIAQLTVSSHTATTVTFKNTSRVGSSSSFVSGAKWTVDLQFFKNNGSTLVVDVQPDAGFPQPSNVGTQETFTVNTSAIATATSAVLTVTVDNSQLADVSCQGDTSVSGTSTLLTAPPDPQTPTVVGCAHVGDPCTLTVSSLGNPSLAGWTIGWTKDGLGLGTCVSGTPVACSSVTATFSSAGQYSFIVTASNAFGQNAAQKQVNVAAATCSGAPTNAQISFNAGGSSPSCNALTAGSPPCTNLAQAINFSVNYFGYTLQSCDTVSWAFGDGGTATGPTASHTYTSAGTRSASVTISNSNGSAHVAENVTVGTVQSCPTQAPVQNAIFAAATNCGVTGKPACTTGLLITFQAQTFGYTFQSCDSYSWTFGDGGTSTNANPSHTYNTANSYSVTLTVRNSDGSAAVSLPLTVTQGQTGSCSTPPNALNVAVGYSGAISHCSVSSGCAANETITFTASPFGYSFATCNDSLDWNWGDGSTHGSGVTATHSYTGAQGSYIGVLTDSNGAGSTTIPFTVLISGAGGTPPTNPGFTFTGSQVLNSPISFSGTATGSVDTWSWTFGDGGTGNVQNPTHTYTSAGTFTVRLNVSFQGAAAPPVQNSVVITSLPAPTNVDFTSTGSLANSPISFFGTASGTVTSWSWDFGDGSFAGTGQNPTHTFASAGTYTVKLTASNGGANAPLKSHQVVIAPANSFSFLLPVVTHLENSDGTKWETDLLFFNPDPNFDPSNDLKLTFSYNGASKTLSFDNSTDRRQDFGRILDSSHDITTAVVVTGASTFVPQMWTRTYIVGPSGVGTYGQLIPAVPLDQVGQSDVSGNNINFIAGLTTGPKGSQSKFRTNLGVINPSANPASLTFTLRDANGLSIGQPFTQTVNPFALLQVNDPVLRANVPELQISTPFSVEVERSTDDPFIAYGSIVDNASDDPAYVQGVGAQDAAGTSRSTQLLPGLAHFTTGAGDNWRSDISIYNADDNTIQIDLEIYDPAGTLEGAARSLVIGAHDFLELGDILACGQPGASCSTIFTPSIPTDLQAHTLKVITTSAGVDRYPVVYARTFNDRGVLGTFGQGVPAFAPGEANVIPGNPAYLVGIRSDSSFYTNLGLVSASSQTTTVRVTLLDEDLGLPLGSPQSYTLSPGQSVILGSGTPEGDYLQHLQPGASLGTLKIEIVSGGNVWAYGSIVDRLTKDPEYVPATPSN